MSQLIDSTHAKVIASRIETLVRDAATEAADATGVTLSGFARHFQSQKAEAPAQGNLPTNPPAERGMLPTAGSH